MTASTLWFKPQRMRRRLVVILRVCVCCQTNSYVPGLYVKVRQYTVSCVDSAKKILFRRYGVICHNL